MAKESKQEYKDKLLLKLGVYGANHIKAMLDKGLLPETRQYIEREELDFRSVSVWRKAYYEASCLSPIDIVCSKP